MLALSCMIKTLMVLKELWYDTFYWAQWVITTNALIWPRSLTSSRQKKMLSFLFHQIYSTLSWRYWSNSPKQVKILKISVTYTRSHARRRIRKMNIFIFLSLSAFLIVHESAATANTSYVWLSCHFLDNCRPAQSTSTAVECLRWHRKAYKMWFHAGRANMSGLPSLPTR